MISIDRIPPYVVLIMLTFLLCIFLNLILAFDTKLDIAFLIDGSQSVTEETISPLRSPDHVNILVLHLFKSYFSL